MELDEGGFLRIIERFFRQKSSLEILLDLTSYGKPDLYLILILILILM